MREIETPTLNSIARSTAIHASVMTARVMRCFTISICHGDAREIALWAQEHELPYFDERVHFPDFRVEYERDGREGHKDVEVLTPHYRGAHAANRTRTGFVCVRVRTSGRSGGSFDPGLAEELI